MLTLLSNLSKLASGLIQLINAILVLTEAMDKEDTKLQETDDAVTKFIDVLESLDYGDQA